MGVGMGCTHGFGVVWCGVVWCGVVQVGSLGCMHGCGNGLYAWVWCGVVWCGAGGVTGMYAGGVTGL